MIDWGSVLCATLLDCMIALLLAGRVLHLPLRVPLTRLLMAVGLCGYIVMGTLAMTDADLPDLPAALTLVMTNSHFGHLQWLALAGLGCLSLPDRQPRLFWPGLALLILSRAATGHAANAGMLSLLVHAVHLFGMALWLGPVLLAAWSRRAANLQLARHLSGLASWALGLIAISGIWNLLRVSHGMPAAANRDYLLWLSIKLVLASLALLLGAANRWHYLPAIERNEPHGLARFWRILQLESVLLLAVLFFAARLSSTMPG